MARGPPRNRPAPPAYQPRRTRTTPANAQAPPAAATRVYEVQDDYEDAQLKKLYKWQLVMIAEAYGIHVGIGTTEVVRARVAQGVLTRRQERLNQTQRERIETLEEQLRVARADLEASNAENAALRTTNAQLQSDVRRLLPPDQQAQGPRTSSTVAPDDQGGPSPHVVPADDGEVASGAEGSCSSSQAGELRRQQKSAARDDRGFVSEYERHATPTTARSAAGPQSATMSPPRAPYSANRPHFSFESGSGLFHSDHTASSGPSGPNRYTTRPTPLTSISNTQLRSPSGFGAGSMTNNRYPSPDHTLYPGTRPLAPSSYARNNQSRPEFRFRALSSRVSRNASPGPSDANPYSTRPTSSYNASHDHPRSTSGFGAGPNMTSRNASPGPSDPYAYARHSVSPSMDMSAYDIARSRSGFGAPTATFNRPLSPGRMEPPAFSPYHPSPSLRDRDESPAPPRFGRQAAPFERNASPGPSRPTPAPLNSRAGTSGTKRSREEDAEDQDEDDVSVSPPPRRGARTKTVGPKQYSKGRLWHPETDPVFQSRFGQAAQSENRASADDTDGTSDDDADETSEEAASPPRVPTTRSAKRSRRK